MANWYDAYLEAQKKKKQDEKQGKIYFAEASKASRPQTTLPGYQGNSKKKSYQWETDTLRNVRGMGRSYNDKFQNIARHAGMSDTQANEYRRSLDFEEDRKQKYKLNDDGSPNQRSAVRAGQGAHYQSEILDGILKNMNQRVSKSFQENKIKELEKEKAAKQKIEKTAKREANPTVLDNLKNFLTGKDTDKDGQRDGLLGALDRFVLPISQGASEFLAPGNNERMIQNDIEKHGTVTNPVNKASLVDRGTETKVLHGAGTLLAALAPYGEAYKAADYGFNKLPRLVKAVTNPYVQKAIKGAAAGGMAEAGLSAENELFNSEANDMKDYAIRTGLGVAGGAILDPALYGVGQGLKKGVESTVNNTMKKIVPDKKEAAHRLSQILKEYHQEQAPLPGKPDLRGAKELIPSGNDVTNPNFVSKLNQSNTEMGMNIPKVGQPIDEVALNNFAKEIDPPVERGVKIYRRGREDGNWWSESQDYVDRGFSRTRPFHEQTFNPETSKVLDLSDGMKPLEDLMTSEEAKLLNSVGNQDEKRTLYQNVLERNGYDAFKYLDGDEYDNEFTTYFLANPNKSKALANSKMDVSEPVPPQNKYQKEFEEAVQNQYDYLKNSMGKGTTPGGLIQDKEGYVTGAFGRVSNNPKWYQDFYAANKRKPTNAELHQLAEQHVKEGFQDEIGNIPAWQPKQVQEIDNQIDEIVSTIRENPEQEPVLQPILDGLQEDKAILMQQTESALNEHPVLKQQQEELMKTLNGGSVPKTSTPKAKPVNVQQPAKPSEAPQQALETNVVPMEQPSAKQQVTPNREPKKPNERSFYNTVQNPEKLSPELEQRLADYDKTYQPMSNEETVKFANAYVKKDMEKAYQFVKNAKKFDPRHVTVGHRLIDELQKAGDFNKALDVVERLAEQGTKAGQSIQSYSIYNRLSAEGQLLRAQRHINKINQDITNPAKQVKLTPQHVEDITHTADSIQKFAGQMDQANNVMKIMENVKKGKVATDVELETVRSFVTDAKKFFGDLSPNMTQPKVKPVKDVRTRDKVVDFMSKKEDVARQELQKIFGRANSMPVDAFYHLSTIGASKIAKGTVKLADFTEEMVKEFGEMVRPYAKQIYNKAAETFNLQSESMTRQRLSEVEKITNKALKDKNLSADEADSIREFAHQVGLMSGDAKLESSMELQTVLQSLDRPTFGQKLSSAQTIAQLLNPKTIVRNAIGNELFYRVEQINKLVATPVDILRSKITGGERTITFRTHNQGKYWQNWLTGAKAGWKGVNPMGLQTAYDLGPQAFRSKFNPLTYMEKSLGATLRSFDHAGYMRAYNKTLGELATLRATNEGLKGTAKKEAIAAYIREADANTIQIADQYGKYATFQDNTAISTVLQKGKRLLNFNKDFGLGDLIIKYPKTPGNLISRALEYSPAGVARSLYLLKGLGKAKNPLITKEATLAFTRAIIGTGGFSILGYALADKGILTTSGDSDYEVASLERNAGKQPNSVNASALGRFIQSGFNLDKANTKEGDTFVSFDWAQPISLAIVLGTSANQSVKENGKVDAYEAVKKAGDSVFNTTVNMSVLKGLKDFLTSYPGQGISDKLGGVIEGSVSSFVPTLSNQVRQLNNNEARTTYSPKLLPTIKNKAINRVPGLDKLLPPAYDTLGNQRETYQNKGNNLFNVLLNPSFVSKYKPSPEAKFVLDLINSTGDKSLAPRMAQKKLDGKPLTSEQYAEMQRIMGETAQAGLSEVYSSGPSDEEAIRKAIEKVLREAGKKGREAIRAERGE